MILTLLRRLKHILRPRSRVLDGLARWRALRRDVVALGLRHTWRYRRQRGRVSSLAQGTQQTLTAKHARHPLLLRARTSDWPTFKQIFIDREYRCLDDVHNVDLVIDCGANVGYASAYFLTRWSQCRVIAIEPDPENFQLLQQNLAPYGARVELRQAGVWPHSGRLQLEEMSYSDDRAHWSRKVRECSPDEQEGLPAVDLETLLKESGAERISLLKIDIEGAEARVFGENYEGWLSRVDHLVIELHEHTYFGAATPIFEAAIADQNFAVSRCDELTVCRRTTARSTG